MLGGFWISSVAMAQGAETHHFWNPASASASGGRSLAFKSAVVLTSTFTVASVVSLIVEPLYGEQLVDSWLLEACSIK